MSTEAIKEIRTIEGIKAFNLPLALCCLLSAAGCSDDEVPPALTLRLAPTAASCEAAVPPEALSALSGGTLRLTLQRRASAGAQPELLCDQTIDLSRGGTTSDVALDAEDEGRIDLIVEVFSADAAPKLVASGRLPDLNARPRVGGLEVLLTPVDRFSCTPSPARAPRAFHTATALPDGQVLLVGGVTDKAPAGASGAGLWIESRIELYDPRAGRFLELVGELPRGRAFHRASLLGGPVGGPYDVLLVGGIAAKDGQTPLQPAARLGGAGDPLPVVPADGSEPAQSTIVRVFPFAEPPQIQVRPASPQLAARIFASLARLDDGTVLVAGGLQDYSGGRLATADTVEQLPAGTTEHRGPFGLQRARVAAAAAPVSATQVLVVGGNLDSSPALQRREAIEVLDVATGVTSRFAAFEVGSLPRVRALAHATLSPLATAGELLLTGGLVIEQGQARAQRADFPVQRLTVVSGELRVSNVASALFVPVAYHAATTLESGEVLLTGGLAAPKTCAGGDACNKAYRYRAQADDLAATESLVQGRFGHTATVLPGTAVLITGGLTIKAGVTTAVGGAELYNQVGLADPFGRGPGEGTPAKFCPQ